MRRTRARRNDYGGDSANDGFLGSNIRAARLGGARKQVLSAHLQALARHGARCAGVRVWDANGKVYLDLVAGIATNVLGHAHPNVVRAIKEQADKLIHVSNLYINERQVELAEQLYNVSGGMRSFFSNSGAEAVEGAIKLARKFGRQNRGGAFHVISMDRSFHGRTLATTAATGQQKYQDTWLPLPEGFMQVPFNDLDAVKAATTDKTIAVLVEAVQGEGGIFPASPDYLQGLRRWCDEQNLIAGNTTALRPTSRPWQRAWRAACRLVRC